MLNPTSHWRLIVEFSCMKNNDEHVFFTGAEITSQNFRVAFEKLKPSLSLSQLFDEPSLIICRPVYQEEFDLGLSISRGVSVFDEDAPEITKILDGLYKLLDEIKNRLKYFKPELCTPIHILDEIIASHYYDCMSGGMPTGMVVACRRMIKSFDLDLSHPVYPGKKPSPRDARLVEIIGNKEGWYTLKDFIDETEAIEAKFASSKLFDDVLEVRFLPAFKGG